MKHIVYLLMFLGLFACVDENTDNLENFVETEKKKVYPINDKIPELKDIEIMIFNKDMQRDPFSAPRAEIITAKKNAPKSCPQPDFDRKKEVLEMHSLSNLQMRGTLQSDGELRGLVQSADGKVHQVKVGDYLGLNFGKVFSIVKGRINLLELAADKDGCWHERKTQITLLSK